VARVRRGEKTEFDMSAGFDLAGDAVVLLARDDVPFDQFVGVAIGPMRDDTSRGSIVDARQGLEILKGRAVDVDGALVLYAFDDALSEGLCIPSRSGGRLGGLPANLVRTALIGGAASKKDRDHECEGRELHV
jgi:hypothetical protein